MKYSERPASHCISRHACAKGGDCYETRRKVPCHRDDLVGTWSHTHRLALTYKIENSILTMLQRNAGEAEFDRLPSHRNEMTSAREEVALPTPQLNSQHTNTKIMKLSLRNKPGPWAGQAGKEAPEISRDSPFPNSLDVDHPVIPYRQILALKHSLFMSGATSPIFHARAK